MLITHAVEMLQVKSICDHGISQHLPPEHEPKSETNFWLNSNRDNLRDGRFVHGFAVNVEKFAAEELVHLPSTRDEIKPFNIYLT